jgi:hypothetical protein
MMLYFAAVTGYGFYSYHSNKASTLKNIDEKLILIASGIKRSLPKGFHDRAMEKDSISKIEDSNNVLALSDYLKKTDVMPTGILRVFTLVKKDGKVYYTSSSKTEKELELAIETPYFLSYDDASIEVISAFESDDPTFVSEKSKWGCLRKILIPEKSLKGIPYLAGVDIDIMQVEKKLNKHFWSSTAICTIFIILVIPLIFLFKRSEKEHVEEFENLKEMLHQKSMHRTTKIEEKINEYIRKK